MWRRRLSLFVAALFTLTASAEFEVDGIYYENVPGTSDEVYVWGIWQTYEGSTSMSIPSIIKVGEYTYKVTQVRGAFKGVTTIESVHLPSSIMVIDNQAFNGCANLSEINLPESLQRIGYGAFANCTSLHEIKLPSSLKSLGEYAFAGSGLREVVVPPSCTEIEQYIFQNCRQLERVVLPDTWTSIPYKTFEECYNLQSINLPSSLTRILDNAFGYCHALESIEIPNGVTVIYGEAFRNCIGLKSVSFPSSLTEIGAGAFSNCTALESVSIPSSVTTIGERAFWGCPLIKEVVLEDGESELRISDDTIVLWERETYDEDAIDSGTWHFLHYNWCNTTFPYVEKLYIGRPLTVDPFLVTATLTDITFGDQVLEIREVAFKCCETLQSVTLSSSIKSIGAEAFLSCHKLRNVVIPEGCTQIGERAFRESGCTNITLPQSLTKIGEEAFSYTGVSHIDIPPQIETIEEGTFQYSNLKSISLGNVITIKGEAFRGSKLRCLEIPVSVKTIEGLVFRDCPLENIKVNSLTPPDIDGYTFGDTSIPLYVPERAFDEYCATRYWKEFVNIRKTEDGIPVSSVTMTVPEIQLEIGKSRRLPYTVFPVYADNTALEWSSSNESAVTVNPNGEVTAVGVGESLISYATLDSTNLTGTINVKVAAQETLPVADGAITPGRYYLTTTRTAPGKYLGVDRAVLTRTNKPDESCCWIVEPQGDNMFHISNAATGKYLMSSDCSLTSAEPVDLYLFTGQAAYGISRENDPKSKLFLNAFKDTEFVTSWSYDAGSSWALVPDEGQVLEIAIKRQSDELRLGDVESMMAKVYPETAANPTLLYLSENPDVVTVDEDGMMTGLAEGYADIVVSAADGYGASAKYRVTVTAQTARPEIVSEINEPEVWYDLQGRRVATPQTRGLFISNGRKVLRTGR